MSDDLKQFVSEFVNSDKKDRYIALLSSKKRRSDGVWDLLHDGRHFDKSKFYRIPSDQVADTLVRLKSMGANGMGYVLACHDDLDGKTIELGKISSMYLGKAKDVAVYFSQANAGYYENHEGEIYVFSSRS